MRTFFIATTALALSAIPAHAQLVGGGLGGAIGGTIGVGGVVGGVSGSVDAASRTVVAAPSATVVTRVRTAVPSVATTVVVPAVPNVVRRRAAIVEAGIAPVSVVEVPAYVDHQYVILQDELRGTGVQVIKRKNQIVLEMPSDVTFAFDRYNIQPRFYGALSAVSRTLARYPATYVDVYGHTDAIGSYTYNQRLSERRADMVADFLAASSVNSARMHVEGFGKTQPIASNATIEGRAANRRVEIVLTPYTS
ncbi:OmpA family protein [Novosphingobium flavum]|uniref:OmpA family protein n=1 Tax=Novosphingobium flavum TaxID=1778672 RepID=A0A7X1KN63_9SPHN|nr:OmpA family protein [Novosphingobium flavum]MBC2667317.1 OmpA family protein [Novosphingobium flavum]